ncbi:hypothetical protein PHLGIDRAFT_117096 [Phlebiopsis gigantea 11061_1 CR5-6]|uniref:N-acetyltransferase domain-containing protein n=1 Tax=Phlebiopsis gigantea (strain 11061_1 CR5-6) TaxID=745531 RepID=A0A0C3SC75_PHLG1|nr:hypothetical protein PHLGIDRAFT_117096 [Phlebiopsis gigantea 11061_1 CR5-6]
METHSVDRATLNTNEDVIPERMRYGHIACAADASMANLTDDPLVVYISDGPQEGGGGLLRAVQKSANSYAWWREVEHEVAWTIHGDSFIIFHSTRDDKERMKTPLDKILRFLVSRLIGMFPEQETSKRHAEFASKREAAISASLGDEVHNMVYIDNLITMREARGRGYASALVHMVTELADKEGRGAWLVSSNIANERFYNSLGFTTVERFTVGENNPAWDKPPVPIDIMTRKPPCEISVAEKPPALTNCSA